MIRLSFFVAGHPVSYKRRRSAQGVTFTPPENREWRAKVLLAFQEAMRRDGWSGTHDKAVILAVAFHGSRGDLSNLVKEVEDALNGEAYADDRQIYRIETTRGLDPDHEPGAHVTLTFTDDHPMPVKRAKPRKRKTA